MNSSDTKIVSFYSFKGGSGRTSGIVNVGVCLARLGYNVLCIDLNLTCADLAAAFGRSVKIGLEELLWHKDFSQEALRKVIARVPKLQGTPFYDKIAVVGSKADPMALDKISCKPLDFEEFFKAISDFADVDYILLDVEIGFSDIAATCITLSDSVVYYCGFCRSHLIGVERCLKILKSYGLPFAVVLSGVDFSQERTMLAPTLAEINKMLGVEPIAIVGESPLLRWSPVRATIDNHIAKTSLTQEFMSVAAWITGRELAGMTEDLGDLQKTFHDVSLGDLWYQCTTEKQRARKGYLLEHLCKAIFSLIPGFEINYRVHTRTEEIDLVIRNRSTDPFWEKLGAFFLIECKNTKRLTSKNDLVIFSQKMSNRFGKCSVGFLVSATGFAQTVHKEHLRFNHQDAAIVLIGPDQLRRLIDTMNANAVLMDMFEDSVFR